VEIPRRANTRATNHPAPGGLRVGVGCTTSVVTPSRRFSSLADAFTGRELIKRYKQPMARGAIEFEGPAVDIGHRQGQWHPLAPADTGSCKTAFAAKTHLSDPRIAAGGCEPGNQAPRVGSCVQWSSAALVTSVPIWFQA
jgi:hypothetical protein